MTLPARRSALVLVLLSAAAACGPSGPPTDFQMVDSAGITVVTAPAPFMDTLPAWTAAPVLEIGGREAAGPAAFATVLGVHRRTDGSVVVLDAGAQELRWFDAGGTHVRSFGGEGDGPAEFRRPWRLDAVAGDSLLVWDQGLNRLSFVAADGSGVRTALLDGPPTSGLYLGRLADGHLVFSLPSTELPTATAPVTRDTGLRLHAADGAVAGSLGPFPYQSWYRTDRGVGSPVFAPATDFAVAADGIWVGTGAAPEVVRVTPAGSVTRVVRWSGRPVPVTQELRDAQLEAALARTSGEAEAAEVRRVHGSLLFANRLPAYRRIHAGADGRLWVEGFNARPGDESTEWLALDAEGRPVGRLQLPGSFRLWEARGDHLSGVLFDENDVARVVVYEVSRP